MALSTIIPIIDIDFTNPAQSNAVDGIFWNQPGDVDLATFYPEIPPLYFARTQNCTNTKVYIDRGVVLESRTNSTKQIATFGFSFELPAGHNKQIYVLVEFDVAEAYFPLLGCLVPFFNLAPDRPFLGAIAAVATESQMKAGIIEYADNFSASTAQLQHNAGSRSNSFRLNAPRSNAGQPFTYTPFDFYRPMLPKPIPPTTAELAFANRSTFPLVLEHTITASNDAGTQASVEVNLSQNDTSARKYFVCEGESNRFESTVYTNSLRNLGFAGVGLSITEPRNLPANATANPGPVRVRITRLAIGYA